MHANRLFSILSVIVSSFVLALILVACSTSAEPSNETGTPVSSNEAEHHTSTPGLSNESTIPQTPCGPVDLTNYTSPPFQNPPVIASSNGELSTTLVVTYTAPATTKLGDCQVYLRSYNGNLVGPTLRAKPGDTLRILLDNQLPPNPLIHHVAMNTPHDFNTTNLHTHGLHVSPVGNSDNVLLAIEPQTKFQYEIKIPADHPSGTFWYHPHKHGSTALQVASGMGGALIIEGTGLDTAPEIAAAQEQIFVFQQIPYSTTGSIELTVDTFGDYFGPCTWEGDQSALTNLTRTHSVNGQVYPTLTIAAGEVQRWRFIHAGVRENISVELRGPGIATTDIHYITNTLALNDLHEIAVDGLALGRMSTWQDKPVDLAPGQRSDVLVQVMKPGTYYLIDGPSPAEALTCPDKPEEPDLLAKVIVTKATGPAMLLPASDDALARYKPFPDIIPITSSKNPTNTVKVDNFQETSFTVADYGALNFLAGDHSFDETRIRQLQLGNTELWTMTTKDDSLYYAHPFHIHVNPFQTWRIGPDGSYETLWRDTILVPKGQNTYLYTRYLDYIGKFVYHCHILDHEDQGMMELLEVVLDVP
jgi:FtsP/CotA-like multicopper oxidase with cupredoxin domain